MKSYFGILIFAAVFGASAEPSVPLFGPGERVAFVGDSITHGGSYHSDVYLFYATRFPHAPFRVYNCGISGDTVPGANRRFEQDIAARRPDRATVMLGMNDAWAWLFNPDEPSERRQKGVEDAYGIYTNEMNQLVDRLKGIDCEIVLIKPSIYDQTAELKTQNLVGKNDLLGRFSDSLDGMAEQVGGSIIDFRTPMVEINEELQATDPSATVVGPDRVHPGVPGHFIMTYAFLRAQGMPTLVSSIEMDGAGGLVAEKVNCTIRDVAVSSGGVSFRCMENALPFPVGDHLRTALQWVPFQEELNQQLFRVTHLDPGTYELKIDDCLVGSWSAGELAEGINLSGNLQTPQVAQALEVKAVNDQRRMVEGKLRSIMLVRHTMISKLNPAVDEEHQDEVATALKAHLEKYAGESWSGYLSSQVDQYLEYAPQEQVLSAKLEDLMDRIWVVNRPQFHHWELVKAEQ